MNQPRYQFRWFRDGGDSEIPADLLAQALGAAQRAFHYAGMIAEDIGGLNTRLRARVPADVARKYVLRCTPPVKGSYEQPTILGNRELVDDPAIWEAANLFGDIVDAGCDVQGAHWIDNLPSGVIGRALLLSVSQLAPPRGSGWSLEVRGDNRAPRVLTEDAHRRLEDLARTLEDRPTVERGTVTGELRVIDFARKKITILHLDDRELECSYAGADEIALINQRLSLVHVTGRLIRDITGRVTSIDEVDEIEPLDTSPIEIGRVTTTAGVIRPINPIVITPEQEPEALSQWMTVSHAPLGLTVTAPTRSMLVDAIREEIAFLWEEYVVDSAEQLSPGALSLRKQLQAHFKEVENASS